MIDHNIYNINTYKPKLYHKCISFNEQNNLWMWMQYAPSTHTDIIGNVKDKSYFIEPDKIGKFISKIPKIEKSGNVVPLSDIIFIRNDNGYYMAISGYYEKIKINLNTIKL